MKTCNILIINSEQEDPRITWCKENLLTPVFSDEVECKIDENNKLIITGDIVICSDFEELPIKIDEVYGSVKIDTSIEHRNGNLTSLKNFPTIIHGALDISLNNKLTSFEGGPEVVEGTVWALSCGLTSLKGMPKQIGGALLVAYNNITDISELKNSSIDGNIDIDGNPLNDTSSEILRQYLNKQLKIFKKAY